MHGRDHMNGRVGDRWSTTYHKVTKGDHDMIDYQSKGTSKDGDNGRGMDHDMVLDGFGASKAGA
jgi:hypothetical protein